MRKKILQTLKELEEMHDVEIFYTCESGSRVWGFANDESDYDVRFIYKKNNLKDYLSLRQTRDVIECQSGLLDIVGWDIKKALILHYKDNPNLREWFLSNEKYIDNGVHYIFSDLGGFDIDTLKNHYASFALKSWRKYSSLDFNKAKTKKYLYVIRSILCWKLLNMDIYPPINIYELLNHDFTNIPDDVRDSLNDLIRYHSDDSIISEEEVFVLNNFILDSLRSMKKVKVKSFKNIDDYDERFRELLLIR